MRKYFALLLIFAMVLVVVGCQKKESYNSLDTDASGEITVMLWSGDGTFIEDVGKLNLTPDDLAGQNNATIYAVAKAFNEIYPNVKINVFAKEGGPDNWEQERENFREQYGHYPDIWASTDLVGDVSKGLVADLSIFEDDPLYQSFNPAVMQMMNYFGMQAGLPQYLLPWGVYVNRQVADDLNLDVPQPNWTIEEYTEFASFRDLNAGVFGAMDTPFSFIFTGTNTLAAQLHAYDGTDAFMNMNSNEVRALLAYVPQWAEGAVWPNFDLGNIEGGFMDEHWWWGFKFFIENKLLTLDGDPWMMGDAAHPTEGHWGRANSTDWDIYPRPSTPYQDNTVGVVLDPLAIYNYAMDDGNPEMSEEEYAKLQIAYTFSSFWVGDDRAWQARADQLFLDGDNYKSAMNDSFPLVTGEAFDRQMDIWFGVDIHELYADPVKMPGFHKILELWEAGNLYDVSDKAYPWYFDDSGTRRPILDEWMNMWNPAVITGDPDATSPRRTDAAWLDTVLGRLPQWNTTMNSRFAQSIQELKDGLIEFYGYSEDDF